MADNDERPSLEKGLFKLDGSDDLAHGAGRNANYGIVFMGTDGIKIIPVKTNADGELVINLEASSITIGDVRIKDAVGAFYASIEDADTARTTGTKVMAVQIVDAAGKVLVSTDLTDIKTSVEIMDDWDESDRAKVNLIVGQAGIAAGAGVMGVTVPRITIATDDTHFGVVGVAAGTAGAVHAQLRSIGVAAELIDDAIVTDEAVHSAKSMQVAGHYAASPVELTNDQAAAILIDSFRRMVPANHDGASGTGLVTDLTSVSGVPFTPGEQTTLTAPGDGVPVNAKGFSKHTWAVTVVLNTCTSVDVAIHGKLVDSAYGNIEGSNPPVDTQFTADGTYFLTAPNAGFDKLKPVFVSEAGDTDSTVTFEYMGVN